MDSLILSQLLNDFICACFGMVFISVTFLIVVGGCS